MGIIRSSVCLSCLFLVLEGSANAQLRVCNQTNSSVEVAISVPQGSGVPSLDKGWYEFAPGECAQVISSPLEYTSYSYYARYSDRSKTAVWGGDGTSNKRCLDPTNSFEIATEICSPPSKAVSYRMANIGQARSYTIRLSDDTTLNFADADVRAKACEVLNENLDRPRLRSQQVVLGSYTDPFTLPQTRTECTNVYDTGVPDPSTCRLEYDECASEWHGPFGSRGCVPGMTNRCTNIKACNTWKTEKRWMECDLQFQLKLPNYVEKPLSEFIDNSYDIVENARRTAATSLPLQCAPRAANTGGNVSQSAANQIVNDLRNAVINALRREGEQWLKEAAIKAIAASIPSGGIGGPAVMSTELAQFVYRAHRALKPIIEVASDAKDLAEDVGFSTSCGWGDWSRL